MDNPQNNILFVDDEPFVLFAIRRFLKQNNINVDVESDSIKAVELLREKKYQVIISDFKMPNLNGADFFEISRAISPDTIRILLSAHINQESLMEIVNKGEVFKLIEKPWNEKELVEIINESINKYKNKNKIIEELNELKEQVRVISNTSKEIISKPEIVIQKEIIPVDNYWERMLPKMDFKSLSGDKLAKQLRDDVHIHLNYVMNLTSNKVALHCKRVGLLSTYIAKIANMNENQQKNIYYAGLYHDIGKIYELVAQAPHDEISFNILNNLTELKECALIVKGHHMKASEKDFSGLCNETKILSIVDYFDKKLHHSKYNVVEHELSLSDIINEMEIEMKELFDPEMFNIFKDSILKNLKLDVFMQESKVHLIDLEDGNILSRPIFTETGKLLLNSDYKITKDIIIRLFEHNKFTPIKLPLFIYTKKSEKPFNFSEFIESKIKINY